VVSENAFVLESNCNLLARLCKRWGQWSINRKVEWQKLSTKPLQVYYPKKIWNILTRLWIRQLWSTYFLQVLHMLQADMHILAVNSRLNCPATQSTTEMHGLIHSTRRWKLVSASVSLQNNCNVPLISDNTCSLKFRFYYHNKVLLLIH
jgi:hypothetical protein